MGFMSQCLFVSTEGTNLERIHPPRHVLERALQQSDSVCVLKSQQVYLRQPQLGKGQVAVQSISLQRYA